jgi:hypothetical protein
MLTARTIAAAMAGGVVLHKQFVDGKARYWLSDSKACSHVAVPADQAGRVAESSLVKPCEPGMFGG